MNPIIHQFQQHIGEEITHSPSPFMLWLKPVILSAEIGKLSFQYRVRKEMTNPVGQLHGGITAAIVDDAIGATLFALGEEHFYATIHNSVDYFGPAYENDYIIADTSIIKKGRQLVNLQCEIWNADRSRMLAKGYSNLIKNENKE